MKNRDRLKKEILPLLESFYQDHWRIKHAIQGGSSDPAFDVVENLKQMQVDLSRAIELAREIEQG